MKVQNRFTLFFILFMFITMMAIAGIGIVMLHRITSLIATSPNLALLSIVANKLFVYSFIVYALLILFIIVVSIPIGLSLAGVVTRSYMDIFKNILLIAKSRFAHSGFNTISSTDVSLLRLYTDTLIKDFEIVKEFEKSASWKDGARLLLHEIKNPLTPLKIASQNLIMNTDAGHPLSEDIVRINKSIIEMEKVIGYFKELVNIEFGPKDVFDLLCFINTLIPEIHSIYKSFPVKSDLHSDIYPILGETTLLKILFLNLIKNGLEQKSESFSIEILEKETVLEVKFKTADVTIADPSKVFKLGYSTKGTYRGFGLFLCRKISDYLDLNLQFQNSKSEVIFTIQFMKYQPDNHGSYSVPLSFSGGAK